MITEENIDTLCQIVDDKYKQAKQSLNEVLNEIGKLSSKKYEIERRIDSIKDEDSCIILLKNINEVLKDKILIELFSKIKPFKEVTDDMTVAVYKEVLAENTKVRSDNSLIINNIKIQCKHTILYIHKYMEDDEFGSRMYARIDYYCIVCGIYNPFINTSSEGIYTFFPNKECSIVKGNLIAPENLLEVLVENEPCLKELLKNLKGDY